MTEREDLSILGAPIDIMGCRKGVPKAVERLSTMSNRLKSIDAHLAFFLLRNCLSMPRLLFKLRSTPCYRLHSELTKFDETLRQTASTICNVNSDDTEWQQATHPVAQCGLGLSSAVNASLPAYASSLSATRQLVGQIFQDAFESCPTSELDSVAERWTRTNYDGQETIPKVLVISCSQGSIPFPQSQRSAQSPSPHFDSCPMSLRRLDYCLPNRSG